MEKGLPMPNEKSKTTSVLNSKEVLESLWEDWCKRNPEAKEALISGKAYVISSTLENGMEIKFVDPRRIDK